MAEENVEYDLLEDVGEEVDYDDFTLEEEDLGDLPEDTNDAPLEENPVTEEEPKAEAAQLAAEPTKPSSDSSKPPAATTGTPAQKDAPQRQPGSKKGQQKPAPKKAAVPAQKAGVKNAQAQPQVAGPGQGRREALRGRAPGRGRIGERSGRGRENGREHYPPSRHGTPPLSGGMQMPGGVMAGLPMPPAMMMPGQGQGPRPMAGPMSGPGRMQQGPPIRQSMPQPPPPRPVHQTLQGMERGQQPPPQHNQRPREPIRWQHPSMEEQQHGLQHLHMERQHQRQLDPHMGPQRQLHMERQHQHEPEPRMMPNSAPALPFPPGMGDLLKQRLGLAGAGIPAPTQPRLQMNGKQPSKEGLQMALGMDPIPQMRARQVAGPGQPHSSLQVRLNAPLGALIAGQRPGSRPVQPAQGALLRAGESAEELRMKEERLEQERTAQRKKESEAKRKAEELKAKRAEMAELRIKLQQAENRKTRLLQEKAERERKAREAQEFEAMKQRVLHLEKLVAENAAVNPAAAQQASAALPAAKAAAAAAAPAATQEPQPGLDTGLQVDFEEEEEEAAAPVQAKPSRAAKAPLRAAPAPEARLKPKGDALRLETLKQVERKQRPAAAEPLSIKERLSVRRDASGEMQEKRKLPSNGPEKKAITDLRDLLSRGKRSREGEREEGRIRPSVKSRINRDN